MLRNACESPPPWASECGQKSNIADDYEELPVEFSECASLKPEHRHRYRFGRPVFFSSPGGFGCDFSRRTLATR